VWKVPKARKLSDAGHVDRVVEPALGDVRLADERDRGLGAALEAPSIAASATGWWRATSLACGRRSGNATSTRRQAPAVAAARKARARRVHAAQRTTRRPPPRRTRR
jgi:hypothetical protein